MLCRGVKYDKQEVENGQHNTTTHHRPNGFTGSAAASAGACAAPTDAADAVSPPAEAAAAAAAASSSVRKGFSGLGGGGGGLGGLQQGGRGGTCTGAHTAAAQAAGAAPCTTHSPSRATPAPTHSTGGGSLSWGSQRQPMNSSLKTPGQGSSNTTLTAGTMHVGWRTHAASTTLRQRHRGWRSEAAAPGTRVAPQALHSPQPRSRSPTPLT